MHCFSYLKNPRTLARCALLLAIEVLLNLTVSIPVGQTIRISFGYLAGSLTGFLMGPVASCINEVCADLLGTIIKPTGPYFFGFTASAAVGGIIYGLCFYRRKISWKNVLLSRILVMVVVNLFMNTLWISMLYGKAFFAILPARILKNLLQTVVDFALLLPLLKFAEKKLITQL